MPRLHRWTLALVSSAFAVSAVAPCAAQDCAGGGDYYEEVDCAGSGTTIYRPRIKVVIRRPRGLALPTVAAPPQATIVQQAAAAPAMVAAPMFMMAAPAMVAPSYAPAYAPAPAAAPAAAVAAAGNNEADVRKFLEFMELLKAYENSKARTAAVAPAPTSCAPAAAAGAVASGQANDSCLELQQLRRDVNDLKDVTRNLTIAVEKIVQRLDDKGLLK